MAKVLVVDDLESDRHLVEQHLSKDSKFEFVFAANGVEALERIIDSAPDLVVTDMQMPEMDGLQLVREVRAKYPVIPVILMTAHGSELLAVEALQSGAASYVPKTHFGERLRATVNEVLALAAAERTSGRLLETLDGADFDFTIENDPEMIPQLVDLMQHMVSAVGLCDATGRLRVGVALEEALINAIYHGNLEITAEDIELAKANLLENKSFPLAERRRKERPYCERRVTVRCEVSSDDARFVIRDEGPGFDLKSLPDPAFPGGMDRASGRGILLMHSFMDEVTFNKNGTEVILIKSRDPHPTFDEPELEMAKSEPLFIAERRSETLLLMPLRSIGSFAEIRVQQEVRLLMEHFDDPGIKNVVIDFCNIAYFGSSMLEAMRMMAMRVKTLDGVTAACNLSEVARDILQVANYESLWPIHDSLDAALQSAADAHDALVDAPDTALEMADTIITKE